MKKKYLVTETEYYYDGHGEPDEGGTKKYISDNEAFATMDPTEVYDEDFEILDENYDANYSAQDGYNCTSTELIFKEVKEEEAIEIEKLIREYDKL